jgi:hypothetical protein
MARAVCAYKFIPRNYCFYLRALLLFLHTATSNVFYFKAEGFIQSCVSFFSSTTFLKKKPAMLDTGLARATNSTKGYGRATVS